MRIKAVRNTHIRLDFDNDDAFGMESMVLPINRIALFKGNGQMVLSYENKKYALTECEYQAISEVLIPIK